MERDQPISYLNHMWWRVSRVSINKTNVRALKIYSTNQTPVVFMGSVVIVKVTLVTSGNNIARLTTANAITVISFIPMKVDVDSHRGTKGSNTVHQTLKCHYLIFCGVNTSQDIKIAAPLTLDYHAFDNLSEQWLNKSSKPPPFVIPTAFVAHDDYSRLVYSLTAPTSMTQISAIAESGMSKLPDAGPVI